MKKLLLITTLFFVAPTLASAVEWKIVQDQSKIEFKTMQNTAAVSGSFKKFSGKINFDPAQLATSKIEIEIDINSVEASLADAASTLKTPEWLSVKAFPKATFVSDKISKVSGNKYTASGMLKIKDKSLPVKLEFTMEEYSATKAKAIGTMGLRRSDFSIGAKDPANAHGVKDEVAVAFMVNAVK